MAALAVLAAAAAAVSWDAQYVMVGMVKHNPAIAALEAAIPDVGALIFAALGIALALHGKRAIRARTLNIACVMVSLAMNALAAAPGWHDLAIWVMPSAVYALASDTLIGVIRARAAATHGGQAPAGDEATPMAVIGGLLLWLLRLALAPPSTLTGFRRWALDECPIAPGRKATPAAPTRPAPDRASGATRHGPLPDPASAPARQASAPARPRQRPARPGRAPAPAGVRNRQRHQRRGEPVRPAPPAACCSPTSAPSRTVTAGPVSPRRQGHEIRHPHHRYLRHRADLPEVGVLPRPSLPAAAPPPGPPPAPAAAPGTAPRPRARRHG